MNLLPHSAVLVAPAHRKQRSAAFTMVEIAICLGVVAIALVAIMGVLPTGMRVQKDNREETIINQDGTYLLEAMRGGSQHLDLLTNHFDWIRISNVVSNVRYDVGPQPQDLKDGFKILGLLGTPKYELFQGRLVTNTITSRVRSISGGASEKGRGTREFQFAYLLTSEVVPSSLYPLQFTNFTENGISAVEKTNRYDRWVQAENQRSNFYELRLTFRWPIIETGKSSEVGNNRKTFRALVPGYLMVTNRIYYFLQPNRFIQAKLK